MPCSADSEGAELFGGLLARLAVRRHFEGNRLVLIETAETGALDGVPTSIKDLILTRGWPTRRGSRTIDPQQPWDVDAPATARLREAAAQPAGTQRRT